MMSNYTNEIMADQADDQNKSCRKKGMVLLPFQPLTMTFLQVNCFVNEPKGKASQLELPCHVNGVFSPGVLTALLGCSGVGKTTLIDALAGRKNRGIKIQGDIRISGHPKEQHTFARISGYVEQKCDDIHSSTMTIYESLWFSASLRLPKEVHQTQRLDFIEEVMQLVALDSLRNVLVGALSREQRVRLTIAVELVANPSIIFMDEPTTGLDAHDAAIVMRTVRNAVDSGRTVVCSLHQPTIQIFEAFDEILLLNHRGRVIYRGKLGEKSQTMVKYFQGLLGSPIPKGYNPATWVLEIIANNTGNKKLENTYQMTQHSIDVDASIEKLMIPQANSKPLKFDTTYSKDVMSQFLLCLWRKNLMYWRNPMHSVVRLLFSTVSAIIIGTVFMDAGSKRESNQHLLAGVGALYASVLVIGIYNSFAQPILLIERKVFYREKSSGMYFPIVYALAEGLVIIPYIMVQTILYGYITYFMIQFEKTPGKFLMYLIFVFLTSLYSTFYGIMVVGVTATQHLAAIVSLALYSLWNLFSGFFIPQPSIAGWCKWLYYISSVQWTLRGMITSQLGNVETTIIDEALVFNGTVKDYINHSFDYELDMLGISIAVLIGFCILFLGLYGFSLKYINFQRR